ncbi:MAG: hypothetical protein WD382_04865 [Halofilum sp. (in: g-proteobacteria)]
MIGLRQRGAALFTAIFLMVVLGGLATTVAHVATTQQLTSARSLDSTRAYYAARAQLDAEIDSFASSGAPLCPATPIDRGEIAGFDIMLLECDRTPVNEGGFDYEVYILRVAAYRGDRASGTLVRRELRAVVTNHED